MILAILAIMVAKEALVVAILKMFWSRNAFFCLVGTMISHPGSMWLLYFLAFFTWPFMYTM